MAKCSICKDKFNPQFSTLEKCCRKIDCRTEWAMLQVQKNKDKLWKQKKEVLKNNIKTLSQYEADAKKSFQKWVRLRDNGLPCISCGNTNTTDWAGGHYYSAGKYSGFMFDERNCHKQCNSHCNKFLSGNLLEYRKGLIKRYGIEFVDKLESESDTKRDYKFTKEELIAKKLKYDIKIKELLK